MTRNMNWLTIVVITSLVTSSFQEVTTPASYDYTPSNSTYEYSYDYGSEYESNSTMIEENSEEENSFMMTVEQIGSGVTSIQGLVDQIENAQNAGQTYLQLPEQLDPAKTNVTLERIFGIARQFIEQTLATAEETDSQITQVISYGDRNSTALSEYSAILGDHRESLSQLSSELFMLQSLDVDSNEMTDDVMPGRMETPFSANDTPGDVDPNVSLLAVIDMDLSTTTPAGDDPAAPETVSPLDLDETSYGTPTDSYESFTTVDPDFEDGYGEESSYPTPTDLYGEPISADETSFETAETDSFEEETTAAPYEVVDSTLRLNLVDSPVNAGESENSFTDSTPLSTESDSEVGYLDMDAYGNYDEGLPIEESTYPNDVTPTDLNENGDGLTDEDVTEDDDDVTQDENTYTDDVTPTDLYENGDGLTDVDVTEDTNDVTQDETDENTYPDDVTHTDSIESDDATEGTDDATTDSDENGYTDDLSYLSNESGYDLTNPTTENELLNNLSEILSNEGVNANLENAIENLYPGFGTDEATETQTDYPPTVTTSNPINDDEFSNILAESWSNDDMDFVENSNTDNVNDLDGENSITDDVNDLDSENSITDDVNDLDSENSITDDVNDLDSENSITDDVNDLDSENRYTNGYPYDVLNDESYEYDDFDSEYTARLGLGIGISLVCLILAIVLIIIRCQRIANRRQFAFQRFYVPENNFIKQPNLTPNSTIITVPWQHVPIPEIKTVAT